MKKMNVSSVCTVAAAALLFSIPASHAADTDKGDKDSQRYRALEQKIETLEKRVHDLESQLTERAMPLDGNAAPFAGPDMNELMAQMRDMFGRDDFGNLGGPQMLPPQLGAGGGINRGNLGQGRGLLRGPGMRTQHKPRLGVELDVVKPELSSRFKNSVTEGAFVMSVLPGSPADKAGVKVGDAIVGFDGKAVSDPRALIDAVKTAPEGKRDLEVSRRGEKLSLKVDLGAELNTGLLEEPLSDPRLSIDDQGWLRQDPNEQGGTQARTELKVSALSLDDARATALDLNADQKSKARDILERHQKELSAEFEKSNAPKASGNGVQLNINGNLNALAEKHADAAAKDLAAVFNAEQMKKWNEFRKTNNSISFSQVITSSSVGKAPALNSLTPREDNAADAKF